MFKSLDKRSFTTTDQEQFSILSGDWNPIHTNSDAALNTFAGQCTVHGMHVVLWALESLSKKNLVTASQFKVYFRKIIYLNEEVQCDWHSDKNKLIVSKNGIVVTEIKLVYGIVTPKHHSVMLADKQPTKCVERSFKECDQMSTQVFRGHGDPALIKAMFPNCFALYGGGRIYEMAAISYVVGMECPGRHSLSVSYDVELCDHQIEPCFSVTSADERFKLIGLSIEGQTLRAKIEAIYADTAHIN
jgi:hypothetical protein